MCKICENVKKFTKMSIKNDNSTKFDKRGICEKIIKVVNKK